MSKSEAVATKSATMYVALLVVLWLPSVGVARGWGSSVFTRAAAAEQQRCSSSGDFTRGWSSSSKFTRAAAAEQRRSRSGIAAAAISRGWSSSSDFMRAAAAEQRSSKEATKIVL